MKVFTQHSVVVNKHKVLRYKGFDVLMSAHMEAEGFFGMKSLDIMDNGLLFCYYGFVLSSCHDRR